MIRYCGDCGHHEDIHLHGRACREVLLCAGTITNCPCARYVPLTLTAEAQ